MSDAVVVDASVALKWLLDEEYTEEALRLRNEWVRDETVVLAPALLSFEMANGLYKRVRRGELSLDEAKTQLKSFLAWFRTADQTPEMHARALEIASELGQKAAYDAQYLALAETWNADFWTADEQFWKSAHERYPFVRFVGHYYGQQPQ